MPPLSLADVNLSEGFRDETGMNIILITPHHLGLQLAVAAVLTVLVGGFILASRLSSLRAAASEAWPKVEGVVIETAIETSRRGRQLYCPVVRYRYEVGGERYEGSRIRLTADEGFRKYTRARKVLDSYRAGGTVAVHYDPSEPGVAVLQPSRPLGLPPLLVIAPTAAMYVLFVAGSVLAGH
jgi:uncharacterized protein DUF3592